MLVDMSVTYIGDSIIYEMTISLSKYKDEGLKRGGYMIVNMTVNYSDDCKKNIDYTQV